MPDLNDPDMRAQMLAAVEHLWDGVDEVRPHLRQALRRVAFESTAEQTAA